MGGQGDKNIYLAQLKGMLKNILEFSKITPQNYN